MAIDCCRTILPTALAIVDYPMISSVIDVTSFEQPGLEHYRSLRRSCEHREKGIFIAEGNKVVERFLADDAEVVSLLLTDTWFAALRENLEQRPEPITVFRAPGHLFKSIVGFNYHQGILAVGKIPPSPSLSTFCSSLTAPALFVAFDYLNSAENTGAIIRNCAACGVQAVISGPGSSDPWLRRSVRNSMGTIFKTAIHYSEDLSETLAGLRKKFGFHCIAAHLSEQSISMHNVNFSGNCCVVFGNEHEGVSRKVLDECDEIAVIPMQAGVNSFNVACASAIMLYEAFHRRTTTVP